MNADRKIKNKITSYFMSTKNKKYGYYVETDTYYCVECGQKIEHGKNKCAINKCNSTFIFRIY
jgi:hypothetical protein